MSILGAIVGDIIGSRFERKAVPRELRLPGFELITHDSRYTDDTVLTLATADLIFNPKWQKDYAGMYREYYAKNPGRAYGAMFSLWAENEYAGPYGSYGNGSGMRISPIVDKYDDWELIGPEVIKSASVTHNHPEGIRGAKAIAYAIWYAKYKQREAVSKTILEIKRGAEAVFSYDLSLDPPDGFDCSCQVTVPLAIKAVVESKDFDDCMRTCISYGGDVDTIAAMAGSIAGELWEIPKNLALKSLELVQGFEMVKQLKLADKYIN